MDFADILTSCLPLIYIDTFGGHYDLFMLVANRTSN